MGKESEYKKLFIQESAELLQLMNQSLLALEKESSDKEAINSIFRSAHTLKSMSASMGYSQISDLAHKMEDALDRIRSGKIKATNELIDVLFKAFDMLESMTADVEAEREIKADVRPLLMLIEKAAGMPVSIPEETIKGSLSLNAFERKTLAKAKKDGFHIFFVKVTLDKQCVLKSVRAFMIFRNLHSVGEVVKSVPDSRSIEEERFDSDFGCVVVTTSGSKDVEKKVKEVLEVENVFVEDVSVDEKWDAEVTDAQSGVLKDAELGGSAQSEHIKRLQSIRVDIKRLDNLMNLVEELAITKLRLSKISELSADASLKGVVEILGRLTDDLQSEVMLARLVPVGQVFERFPRLVRDLAKREGKKIRFESSGGDIELDRVVLDDIGDPLIHLIRNAVDHGIEMPEERKSKGKVEEGKILLLARREKNHVFITIEDDGRGLDVEAIKRVAFEKGLYSKEVLSAMRDEDAYLITTNPGFSTKKEVTDVSGRGVGLDVVKKKVEDLSGGVQIESKKDGGSKITLRLPLTTAVIKALMVKLMDRTFAVPISSVLEIITAVNDDIKRIEQQETLLHRGRVLPIVRLQKLFHSEGEMQKNAVIEAAGGKMNVVVVEYGSRQFGVVVDKLLSQQDIVIKQLTKELKGIRGFAGATILGDGSVALVLDVATLV